jgi:hypothetical protein
MGMVGFQELGEVVLLRLLSLVGFQELPHNGRSRFTLRLLFPSWALQDIMRVVLDRYIVAITNK